MASATKPASLEWETSLYYAGYTDTKNHDADLEAAVWIITATNRRAEASEYGEFFAQNIEKIFNYHRYTLFLLSDAVGKHPAANHILAAGPLDFIFISGKIPGNLAHLTARDECRKMQPLDDAQLDALLEMVSFRASRVFLKFLATCDLKDLKALIQNSTLDQRIEVIPSLTDESRVRHALDRIDANGHSQRIYFS